MGKSIADLCKEAVEKYNTAGNTFDDFEIGDEVKIITPSQDFNFFFGETGVVVKNKHSYLGIIVEFHEPRKFKDDYVQKSFNFEPQDLCHLESKVNSNKINVLRNFERTVNYE